MNEAINIACPHCSGINRISTDRLGDHPVCGKCKQAIFEASPVDLHADNFDQHLHRRQQSWNPMCGWLNLIPKPNPILPCV